MTTPNGTPYWMLRRLCRDIGRISHDECVTQEHLARAHRTARELLIARALWSAYRRQHG